MCNFFLVRCIVYYIKFNNRDGRGGVTVTRRNEVIREEGCRGSN